MSTEQIISGNGRYFQMQPEPVTSSSSIFTLRQIPETSRIFDELPQATIVEVSRPDVADISPMLLSYTIEFQYKQVILDFMNQLLCSEFPLLLKLETLSKAWIRLLFCLEAVRGMIRYKQELMLIVFV